jgi:uncharacterized membrane protein YgcG
MAGNFQRPERIKNALDNRKLNLSAPTPGVQGKYASLIWGLYSNNPRLTVYTNDPNDSGEQNGYGKISANLDGPTFFAFLELLKIAVAAPGEFKDKVENKNFIFPGGKRSERPVVVSELWAGKDKDGLIWISVTARDRPKIKFPITNPDFHQFLHGDGTPYAPAETSKLFALGYINMLDKMMAHLMVTLWVEPEKKNPPGGGGNYGGGGGGGGGYNRGGSGGGGGGTSAGGDGDDIPF